MVKTFNAYITHARKKHLIYMPQEIRVTLMERVTVKKAMMENVTSDICPKMRKKLEVAHQEAKNFHALPSGN